MSCRTSATASSFLRVFSGAFTHSLLTSSSPLPLVFRDIQSKGCKSTHILPHPSPSPICKQIAPGQSQAFLYAEPVTGVMHCSPRVTNCSFHNKLQARLSLGGTYEAKCDWFCTEITTQELWDCCLHPFAFVSFPFCTPLAAK